MDGLLTVVHMASQVAITSGSTNFLDTKGQSPSSLFSPPTQFVQLAICGNQTPNVTAPTSDNSPSPDQIPVRSEKTWNQQTDGNSTF